MVVDYDELIYSLEAVERIAKSIEDQFFDLSSIGPSVFFVLLKKNGITLSQAVTVNWFCRIRQHMTLCTR